MMKHDSRCSRCYSSEQKKTPHCSLPKVQELEVRSWRRVARAFWWSSRGEPCARRWGAKRGVLHSTWKSVLVAGTSSDFLQPTCDGLRLIASWNQENAEFKSENWPSPKKMMMMMMMMMMVMMMMTTQKSTRTILEITTYSEHM